MTDKSLRFTALSILLIMILLGGLGMAWSLYKNRCHLTDCSPASWEAIRDIAFSQAGDDFVIGQIMARPVGTNQNDYTDIGPSFIDIEIDYASIKPYTSYNEISYQHKSIRFDDQTLIISSRSSGWYRFLPSQESQEILKKVTVHPRDAFRVTWQLAQEKVVFDPTNSRIAAVLRFDCGNQSYECKPIWEVYYYRGAGPVYEAGAVYVVDAQTGEIVSIDKAP